MLRNLYSELTFTEQEKNILFGTESPLDLLPHSASPLSEIDAENEFERLKDEFFKSSLRLSKMKRILEAVKEEEGNGGGKNGLKLQTSI